MKDYANHQTKKGNLKFAWVGRNSLTTTWVKLSVVDQKRSTNSVRMQTRDCILRHKEPENKNKTLKIYQALPNQQTLHGNVQ
jgi:hypothetical protein